MVAWVAWEIGIPVHILFPEFWGCSASWVSVPLQASTRLLETEPSKLLDDFKTIENSYEECWKLKQGYFCPLRLSGSPKTSPVLYPKVSTAAGGRFHSLS